MRFSCWFHEVDTHENTGCAEVILGGNPLVWKQLQTLPPTAPCRACLSFSSPLPESLSLKGKAGPPVIPLLSPAAAQLVYPQFQACEQLCPLPADIAGTKAAARRSANKYFCWEMYFYCQNGANLVEGKEKKKVQRNGAE